ncbi:MAG: ABC transporter substrate-binding protein, partial [Alphaproteobacteria bacterium]
ALDTGVIDAAEWVGPWNDLAFGLQRIAKYYYQPSFHEAGPSLEFSVNQASYDALPDDLKDLVAAVARASTATAIADFQFNNIVSLKPLVEENQVELRMWPEVVIDAMRTTSEAVIADVAATDAMSTKVNHAYQAYRAQAIEWSRWSDQAMLQIRNV